MTTTRRIITWLLIPPMLFAVILIGKALLPLVEHAVTVPHACIYAFSAAVSAIVFAVFRPKALYVFGHEATHWLFAKLTGHKTGRFTCRGARGYVEIKNPTLLIILAPYFIPFYFLIFTGLYGLTATIFPHVIPAWGTLACGCIISGALSFHIVMTAYALWHGQSDLTPYGIPFSLVFILLMNTALFYFIARIAHGLATV